MTRTLLVARTRPQQRDLLRNAATTADVDESPPLVLTFADLKERLAAWGCLVGDKVRDDLAARVVTASVLAASPSSRPEASTAPGAPLARLAPAVDTLRREFAAVGTSARDLIRAWEDAGLDDVEEDNLQGRRADLLRLLRWLDAIDLRLNARGIVDDTLGLGVAVSLLRQGRRPHFLKRIDQLRVMDPVDATPLEHALLHALARHCPVEIVLPVDDLALPVAEEAPASDGDPSADPGTNTGTDASNGSAKARATIPGLDDAYRQLEARGDDNVELHLTTWSLMVSGPLAAFRSALLRGTPAGSTAGTAAGAPATASHTLHPARVFLAADAHDEARTIAGTVAAWRAQHPQARIAVATRQSAGLTPILDALARANIPCRRRRRTLLESPAARLLLDLVAMRTDGAPRDRLLAILMNPARRGALDPDATARVLSTMRRAAARRDFEDQSLPAGGFRRRLARLLVREPNLKGDVESTHAAIDPILEQAGRLALRGSLAGHFTTLLALTREVVDDDGALGGSEVFEVMVRLQAAATRVRDQASSVRIEGANDVDGIEGVQGATETSRSEMVELFALSRLLETEFASQPWLDDDVDVDDLAVEALTLPELLGRRFEAVFVAGAVEGEIPLPVPRHDRLLSDGDRAFLNRLVARHNRTGHTDHTNRSDRTAGADTNTPRDAALPLLPLLDQRAQGDDDSLGTGLEGLWWLGAMAAATELVVISAPRRDSRGRELPQSALLLDAARVLGATPATLADDGSVGLALPMRPDPRALRGERVRELLRQERDTKADTDTNGDGDGDGDGDSTLHSPLEGDGVRDSLHDDDDLHAHGQRLALAVAQRRHFFANPDAPLEERRGAYAFAVDPRRIARAFGSKFGLHAQTPLTPTRLEALAACRMHGFVQQVMRLDVDAEPGNAIEARVAGTLAHTVLERFYDERAQVKVPFTRFENRDRQRLSVIVDEEVSKELRRATGHQAALIAATAALKTTLLRVVGHLSKHPPVDGVEPAEFELQIGAKQDGKAPTLSSVPMMIGPDRRIFVGGIIDRVDEGPRARAVVDYKTMSAARVREKAAASTLFESHFQLPLYLRLLEHHRPTSTETSLHGYLLSLKEGATSPDIHETEHLRERIVDDSREDSLGKAIGRVILPVLDGTLPPDAGTRCDDCRLQRVCRVPLEGAYAPDPDEEDDVEVRWGGKGRGPTSSDAAGEQP